jgi:micrococcal nuclease
MGKHFRIIEGGRGRRKDGLDEPREPSSIRYGMPLWVERSAYVKPKARRFRSASNFDTRFVLLMLTTPLFGFWIVWKAMAPDVAIPASIATLDASASASDTEAASFGLCHSGGGTNCVVDGDTLHYQGVKIRIADIDTPETHPPRCPSEAELGAAATRRLQELVNAGPFTLQSINRDEDRYGRKLRILTRGGESLGAVLVHEGLARYYEGGRRPWC